MRKAITIAMLALALSCPAYAGEMQNGVTGTTGTTQGPMDNGVYGNIQNGVAGDIPNGAPGNMPNGETGTSSQASTSNPLDGLEITFSLMRNLLGLL